MWDRACEMSWHVGPLTVKISRIADVMARGSQKFESVVCRCDCANSNFGGVVSIELHAPTSSTQKLKLMGKGGQFTYTPTPPHVQAPTGGIRGILEWAVIILINAPARIRTRDLRLWYRIELHAPTSSTQKLKLMEKGGQFTYTPTVSVIGGSSSLLPCLSCTRIFVQAINSVVPEAGNANA
jgi:hypothetical protein